MQMFPKRILSVRTPSVADRLHDFDLFNLLPGCTRVSNCRSKRQVCKFGSTVNPRAVHLVLPPFRS